MGGKRNVMLTGISVRGNEKKKEKLEGSYIARCIGIILESEKNKESVQDNTEKESEKENTTRRKKNYGNGVKISQV